MRNQVAHKGGAGAPRTTWQWEDPEGFTRKKPTREDIERVARAVAAEECGGYSSAAGMFIPFDRETWEARSGCGAAVMAVCGGGRRLAGRRLVCARRHR